MNSGSASKAILTETDQLIAEKNRQAEELSTEDINGRDDIYKEVDTLKKDRDKKIEEILLEILPEAFAVVKETAGVLKKMKHWKAVLPTWTGFCL